MPKKKFKNAKILKFWSFAKLAIALCSCNRAAMVTEIPRGIAGSTEEELDLVLERPRSAPCASWQEGLP